MPQFLDHLKGNLESMTEGEDFPSDEAEFDEDSLGFGLNGEILPGNERDFSPGKDIKLSKCRMMIAKFLLKIEQFKMKRVFI